MSELQLIKFGEEDFDLYFQLVGDGAVMAHICGRPLTVEEAWESYRAILQNNELHPELGRFKVYTGGGEYIGLARLSLDEADDTEAEVGLMLLPRHWKCGHGRALLPALLERAGTIPQLTSLVAVIDPCNEASKKLLLAAGFEMDHCFKMDGLPAEVLVRAMDNV